MKNFNFFEKLWEQSRTLRRVGLVLVMCLITITQAWASNPHFYLTGETPTGSWSNSGTLWMLASPASSALSDGSNFSEYCTYMWLNEGDYFGLNNGEKRYSRNDFYDVEIKGDKYGAGIYGYPADAKNPDRAFHYIGSTGLVRINAAQTGSGNSYGNQGEWYPYIWVEESLETNILNGSKVMFYFGISSSWNKHWIYLSKEGEKSANKAYKNYYKINDSKCETRIAVAYVDVDKYYIGENQDGTGVCVKMSDNAVGGNLYSLNNSGGNNIYVNVGNKPHFATTAVTKEVGTTNSTIAATDANSIYDNAYTFHYYYTTDGGSTFTKFNPADISGLASGTYTVYALGWDGHILVKSDNSVTLKITVPITLNANGGTDGAVTSVNAVNGDLASTGNIAGGSLPTKTDYVFTGFYTSGGTQVINANGEWISNVSGYTDADGKWTCTAGSTLYAHWEDQWNLKGSWDSWDSFYGMENVSSNTYSTTINLTVSATPYEFKVVNREVSSDTWYGKASAAFTRSTRTAAKGLVGNTDNTNIQITADVTGDYTFTFIKAADASNMQVLVKYPCPTTGSGKTLFKFDVSSSKTSGNVCSTTSTDYPQTIDGTQLSVLAGGTMVANTGTTTQLQFSSGAYNFNGGGSAKLTINLDCPLQTGDIVKFVNSSAKGNKVSFCHTSAGYSTDLQELDGNGSSTVQILKLPAGFNNKSTIYLSRNAGTTALKSIEIIRPYSITLDANTNGGKVGGNSTTTVAADGFNYFQPAVRSGYCYTGWYTSPSGGEPVAEPYLSPDGATLYAQYEASPSSGTLFSISSISSSNFTVPKTSDASNPTYIEISSIATVSGGQIFLGNNSTSKAKGGISSNKIYIDGENAFVKIVLECPIATGDKLQGTREADFYITPSATRATTYNISSSSDYVFPAAFDGAHEIYIWKNSTNSYISSITIARTSCSAPTSPSITGATTYTAGQTISLTASATGTDESTTYEWWLGDPNNGGTKKQNASTSGATFSKASCGVADEGTYYCVISNGADCSVTVSQAITVKCTVAYNTNGGTGSAPTDGDSPYASSARVTVKEPGSISKAGYTFIGWNTAPDGIGTYYSPKAHFAITENTTLYAVWQEKSAALTPAGGTLFSIAMNNRAESGLGLAAGRAERVSWHGTVTKGEASFTNTHGSTDNNAAIYKGSPAQLSFYSDYAMLALYLDYPLQQGDVISFTSSENEQLCFTTTTTRATTIFTSSKSYTVPAESPLIGQSIVYAWRNSGDPKVTALTITRPASNYTITLDNNDATYAGTENIAVTYNSTTNVTTGESPAITLPTKTGHNFGGYYNTDDFSDKQIINANGWFNYDVTDYTDDGAWIYDGSVTLYAKWTPKTYSITLEAGDGGTDGSAMATYGATALSDIVLPTKAGYTLHEFYEEKGLPVLKADGSYYADNVSDGSSYKYIEDGKWVADGDQTFTADWTPITVSSITVSPSSKSLEVDATQQLSATISPADALDKTVTWSTSNGSVATVSSTGLVTAKAPGTATITATANDGSGITGTCAITVAYATCFRMVADASAENEATVSHNETLSAGSKNCTTLTGGTVKYVALDGSTALTVSKNNSSSQYGWYIQNKQSLVITMSGSALKVGSVISIQGNAASGNGITINGSTNLTNGTGSQGTFTTSYTVTAGDTHLVGKNVLTITRYNDSRLQELSISNCQAGTICVTPVLPTLTTPNQACTAGEFSEWDATVTNATAISAAAGSQTVSYSWKNSSSVEVATTAAYTPSAAGTYTVTATTHSDASGYIDASVTSSTLTASLYTATSISTQPATAVAASEGEDFTLGSALVAAGQGTLNYQWYSYSSSGGADETSVRDASTTKTYTTSQASAGTYYYKVKVIGSCGEVYSNMITVTVTAGPCFEFTCGGTKSSSSPKLPLAVGGSFSTSLWTGTDAVLTGGTMTNTSANSKSIDGSNDRGSLVFDDSDKEITVTLSGESCLGVGTIITINAVSNNSNSTDYGFKINGNNMSPETYTTTSKAYQEFTQTYTVSSGSLVGSKSFKIKRYNSNKVYLKSISVSNCGTCTTISPELTLTHETLLLGLTPNSTTSTLDKKSSTGAVTYSSSDESVATVNSSGVVTAVGVGTATIYADIAYDGTYCSATASAEVEVVGCAMQPMASVVLTSNSAADEYNATKIINSLTGSQKLDGNGAKFGMTLSGDAPFRVGDVIHITGTMDASPTSTTFAVYSSETAGTSTLLYSTTLSASAAINVNIAVTADNVTTLNTSKKVVVIRSTDSGDDLVNQNPHMAGMYLKRYTCSDGMMEFNNAAGDGNWNTTGNWVGETGQGVAAPPTIADIALLSEPVTVNVTNAKAKEVVITGEGKLTVDAGNALIIAETLTKNGGATAATDVIINSTREAGTGALIIGSHAGTNQATVNFETKVKREDGTGNWINQFIGSPFSDNVPYVDYALQIYKFMPAGNGNRGYWNKLSSGNSMEAFWGYNVLYNDNNFLDVTWTGTLNASTEVTKTGSNATQTDNLFANSWTAPVHIDQFDAENDFSNFTPTIYIFNAGTPQQESSMSGNAETTGAGTYTVIPVSASPWVGMQVIPAMQAFFLKATGASPSVTMNYARLVYTPALTSVGITPTRAPRRVIEEDAPEVIRLHVRGENGWAANTYILGREDFTNGFDAGWDGEFMEGEETAPQLYAPTEGGNMVVDCVPQIEGTPIVFHKGSADDNYTITFSYNGDETWYLNDVKEQKSTRISSETFYGFEAEAGDTPARFVISATPYGAPAVATGIGETEDGVKVKKVLINDHIYIIRGGRIYSTDGAMVR